MSAALQLNVFEVQHSTISNVAKIEKTEKKGRKGKNTRTKQLEREGKGVKRGRKYTYIPRSSTRTSGHEMQKLKINS